MHMKILFVAANIPVPGVEANDIIVTVARRLIDRGSEVHLVFPVEWIPLPRFLLGKKGRALVGLADRFQLLGVPVTLWRYLRLPGTRFSFLFAGVRLGGGHWLFDPDVIHAHYVLPDGEIARKIASSLGKRYVVTARQGDWRKLSRLSERSFLRRAALRVLRGAAAVFSPGKIVADRFADWGVEMQVLPHGVEALPAGIGIEPCEGPLVVSVAASLYRGKQVDWVVKAVAALKHTRSLELRIMGGGEEEARLKSLLALLRVNARFMGHVPRTVVLENLRQSHIFALPSASETFGLVYLEAAVSGCAVIATRGTGVDGLFVDGEEMRFQSGYYEDFLACLRNLVEEDTARISLARHGRERVLKDYLWDTVLSRYEEMYAKVAALRP